jgi:hypothetical protein
MNGPKAAALVFPVTEWELLFYGRYVDDLVSGRGSDRIYTGFAVRRAVFDAVSKRDLRELGVAHTRANRSTRWSTELLVEKGEARHTPSDHGPLAVGLRLG